MSSRPSTSRGSVRSKARAGRYWGIFDRTTRQPKFSFGGAVSDHPHWRARAAAGILLAAFAFAGAWVARRGQSAPRLLWPKIGQVFDTIFQVVHFNNLDVIKSCSDQLKSYHMINATM